MKDAAYVFFLETPPTFPPAWIDRSQRPQRFLEIKLESVREQISFHFNNVPMYVGYS